MNFEEIVNILAAKFFVILPIALTVLQIAPIKVNPWGAVFKWIGSNINGELHENLKLLEVKVERIRQDTEDRALTDMRWHILNFARSCRNGETHTSEQWQHVIAQARKYEKMVEDRDLDNGVIQENTRFIREIYNQLAKEGRIL